MLTKLNKIIKKVYRQISQTHPISDISQTPIKIEANTSTLHSVIKLASGYSVDFTQENTLKDILGFDSETIYASYNYS